MIDPIYHRLNKKLDNIQKHGATNKNTTTTTKHTFYTRLVDLTQVKFSSDQIHTLQLGFNYVIGRNPKQYIYNRNTVVVSR